MAVSKITTLNRIQILDEREYVPGNLGQTFVRLGLRFVENGVVVGQRDDASWILSPDISVADTRSSVDNALITEGFPAVPQGVVDQAAACCAADHTPLVRARWRVTSTREIIRRLEAVPTRTRVQDDGLALARQQLTAATAALTALQGPPDLSLHRDTRFNLAEILPDGSVQVRLRKCVCENGEVISPPQYHRFVLHPTGPHTAALTALNVALARNSIPAMVQSDIDRIQRLVAVVQTPAVITAWRAAHSR